MLEIMFPFLGGIGLFLVGMMLLSNGLVAFAGAALRQALARFTGTPLRAFWSGTLITALMQSSTATTVTLIGFVSAGLITFAQAVGVVIGASLGNTATGWLVAGLGLKMNLGFYTLPLIGLGALLKLLARGRWAELGLALAGFGLLFLGLNTLQEGMRGLSSLFSLADLPSGGFTANLLIMLIGLALTTLLQSSTAAIATTLTALHTGTINFEQAAAVVVGASIGTTLTGALVTLGATTAAKRTALAHILFNLIAGLIAVLLLSPFLALIDALGRYAGLAPGALSLAAFHTLFIAVGVAIFLPFTDRFARAVERVLPERGENLVRHLDASLLSVPTVALEASQRALEQIADRLFTTLRQSLVQPDSIRAATPALERIQVALERAFEFVTRIQLPVDQDANIEQRNAQLHAIDHQFRMCNHLQKLSRAPIDFTDSDYDRGTGPCRELLALAHDRLTGEPLDNGVEAIGELAQLLAALSHQVRAELLRETSISTALRITDTFRWLEQMGHHTWRICHYLMQGRSLTAGRVTAPDAAESQPLELQPTTDRTAV